MEHLNASLEPVMVKTVVLVDDDDDDEFFLRRLLKRTGVTAPVIRLPNAQAAIDYFGGLGRGADRDPTTELVFLDIKMPGLSGFHVLEAINSYPEDRRPIIAMLTFSDRPEDRRMALELGADTYLVKALTADCLADFAGSYGIQWA